MIYVAIVFNDAGKITDAHPIAVGPDAQHSTIAAHAEYVGFDARITDIVYRGSGRYASSAGKAVTFIGPIADWNAAQAMACSIYAATLAVDTGTYLLGLLR